MQTLLPVLLIILTLVILVKHYDNKTNDDKKEIELLSNNYFKFIKS